MSCTIFGTTTRANDIVLRPSPNVAKDDKSDFNGTVLDAALKRSTKRYGPYAYGKQVPVFSRERLLDELVRGEEINVTMVATQPIWEEKLIPIRIPVDLGLSGLRISLIHRDKQAELAAVRSVSDLQVLRLSAGAAWSSRKVFDADGFTVVTSDSYDALVKTLLAGRSDYFPRGLNEAFNEYDARKGDFPELAIEQSFIIDLPLPTYIFVSPKAPRLAKRIEVGLESMVRDGTLQTMVLKFNADIIKRANLCERRVFRIANPLLSDKTPLDRTALWFNPFDKKRGMCAAQSVKPVSKN